MGMGSVEVPAVESGMVEAGLAETGVVQEVCVVVDGVWRCNGFTNLQFVYLENSKVETITRK